MPYVKLHQSILDSSIWLESSDTRIVWMTLMTMANQDGIVRAKAPGITARARVSRAACDEALRILRAPDPDSGTPDHEGRRIIDTPEGILLVNYEAWRDRLDKADRDAKAAARQARWRARQAKNSNATASTSNAPVTPDNARNAVLREVTHSEAFSDADSDAEADADAEQSRDMVTESHALTAPGPEPKRLTRRKPKPDVDPMGKQIATATAWDAYRVAYVERYGTEPVRNAKVNGQIAQLAKRLPVAELKPVIAWYLGSNSQHYVRTMHAVGPLLADAEALRTAWATGREATHYQAQQADKQTGRAQYVRDAIAEIDRDAKAKARVIDVAAE